MVTNSKEVSLVPQVLPSKTVSSSVCYYLEIKGKRYSESALLLFTQRMLTKKPIVIKILREYKDPRYSLETVQKRQQCQVEGLRWNRKFSPEVYIGLARIYDKTSLHNRVGIGKIMNYPTREMLESNAEYGLLMHELPVNRRLDILLKEGDEVAQWQYAQLLAYYVAYMHNELVEPPIHYMKNLQWGSFEQVQRKLVHNLALLDVVLTADGNDHSSISNSMLDTLCQMLPQKWYERYVKQPVKSYHGNLYISERLKDILKRLKKNLCQVLRPDPYGQYFEQRMQQHRVKRCHGDLKAPHIWIAPYAQRAEKEPWKYVCLLDAIDFNPTYNNIDILSDLAMLVIDIQARTKSSKLANYFIERYLRLTGQEDKVSKSVLDYYLVEKAIMWAAVSIIYDDLPDLGLNFLEIAEMRMNDLIWKDLIWGAETLLTIPPYISSSISHSK